ncbi:GNAT family N-acetyltransferase [Kribbella sp. NBC_01510]|uniref:GNAT family N-acetyltransferase n=1 Tax=Kribbella sp. NBC_01510 TaxID=2903581 RepID=UPI0038661CA9
MGWPAGVTTGQLGPEHPPAAVVVANAIATADDSGRYVTLDDFADELDGADSLGVWLGGRLAGYGLVPPPDVVDGQPIVTLRGGIDPAFRRRGLGGPLLDWQLRRAAEQGEVVDVTVQPVNAGGLALVASRGFRPIRYYRVMRRWYDDQPVRVPSLPDGFAMIGFDPRYDELLRLTYNEIFTGQWGFLPKSEEHWTKWFTSHHAFRPELSRIVVDGDRIAAFALGYEFTVDTEQTGVRELWIGQVGALEEYRGRGLARAAISAILREGQVAGFERSALGVDADNPTGASRLYESLGFVTVTSEIQQRLSLVRRSTES